MIYTYSRLIKGDAEIVKYYQVALEHWKEILENPKNEDVESLAKSLSSEQFWFERNCGGRFLGQEIMAVTGLAQFYDEQIGFEGNEQNALNIYEAFQRSYCSMEVKFHSREAAEIFYLEVNLDE